MIKPDPAATLNWDGLVTRIRAGDDSAAVELVSTLGAQMDVYCHTIAADLSTLHRELAVEQALSSLVRKIDKFDPGKASLPTWSRAFVRNAVRDVRRTERESTGAASPLDEWLATTADRDRFALSDFTDNDEKTTVVNRQQALTEILESIGPEDSDLLYARVVEGLPFDAIARRMSDPDIQMNEATVRKRFQRARERVIQAASNDPALRSIALGANE